MATTALDCNDCGNATDEDEAAPSCGAHVLCVSCFTTGDFRCRECHRVAAEQKVAEGVDWFATIQALPSLPTGLAPTSEPEPTEPLDLRHIDPIAMQRATSPHRCSHCDRAIHVGWAEVSYRPTVTHHYTLYFHESCVILR